MLDPGTAIRKAFFDALNGQIFVEGAEIPVVDEKLDEQITEQDIYIALTTQSSVDRHTKSKFAHEVTISAVVVQRTFASISKTVIEYVTGRIAAIVLPSVGNHGLTIDSPFRITYVQQVNSETQAAALVDESYIIAKQLNFRNRITQ